MNHPRVLTPRESYDLSRRLQAEYRAESEREIKRDEDLTWLAVTERQNERQRVSWRKLFERLGA